jgi:hypothetical protein
MAGLLHPDGARQTDQLGDWCVLATGLRLNAVLEFHVRTGMPDFCQLGNPVTFF